VDVHRLQAGAIARRTWVAREDLRAAHDGAARSFSLNSVARVLHNRVMRLEKPEVSARHRGVRPVFLLSLALALSLAVLVATRAQLASRMPATATERGDWFLVNKGHCNPVEVTTFLATHDPGPGAEGAAQRAACLAIAGKVDAARAVIVAQGRSERDIAVNYVFLAAHPVADAGDDASAGPIMELVVEFQPDQYMALYHAGMAAAIAGEDDRARRHLIRFLEVYRSPDGWNQNATRALAALVRPKAQRTVGHGGEGSIIY
jgi:hypothetical protein